MHQKSQEQSLIWAIQSQQQQITRMVSSFDAMGAVLARLIDQNQELIELMQKQEEVEQDEVGTLRDVY